MGAGKVGSNIGLAAVPGGVSTQVQGVLDAITITARDGHLPIRGTWPVNFAGDLLNQTGSDLRFTPHRNQERLGEAIGVGS